MTTTWDNRIVNRDDVPPEQLLANPNNYRRHTREQKAAFRALIRDVGYIDPVLCKLDDTVIDGHLRVEVALEDGIATIPVDYYAGTDAEADLILATKDPLAAMAYHDAANLDALLREVSTDDAAIMALLASTAESAGVVPPDTFDRFAEWQGMPEFEDNASEPVKQIKVNFASVGDMERFARLIEQKITTDTKSVWYPARQLESIRDKAYVATVD